MSTVDKAPGFNIYHSNDMVCLSELVSYLMKSNPLTDPFDNEWIVIPNDGMKGWIDKKIADSLGISMMIDYDQIWEFTWKLFGRVNLVEDEKPQERYRRENMVWTIYRILPRFVLQNDPAFAVIRDYLNASNSAESFEMDDVKLFQLSEAIASVFDRYIVYRSDWIEWSKTSQNKISKTFPNSFFFKDPSDFNGKKSDTPDDLLKKLWRGFSELDMLELSSDDASFIKQNAWQSILWKSVVSANALGAQSGLFGKSQPTVMAQNGERITEWHIASLIKYFGKHVKDPIIKKNLPERVFIFAIPSLPQMFLELLESLARYIPVHYMLFNPCRKYWGDVHKDKGALVSSFAEKLEKAMRSACNRTQKSEFEFSDDTKALIDNYDENLKLQDGGDGGKNIVYSRSKSGISQSSLVLHDEEGFLDGGNALLTAWGSLGRDNLCRLIKLQENAEAQFREFDVFVDPHRESRIQSVLSAIQKNIFELTEPDPFMLLKGSDSSEVLCNFDALENPKKNAASEKNVFANNRPYRSVTVRSCYTPMREVEAVYDEILARFDYDHSLKPNDIVVMVPDINKYAPFIDAVFGTVPDEISESVAGAMSKAQKKKKINPSRRFIPYQISDQTCDKDSAFLESFMKLLHLPQMRLNGKEILNLLNVDHIGTKFGITGDDWAKICDWVKKLGISCDYAECDLVDSGKLGEGVQIFGVWERALDKLMFGSIMPSDGTPFLDDIMPYSDIEQSDIEIISRLKKFVDTVASLRDCLSTHSKAKKGNDAELLSAREWREFITQNILETLYEELEDGAQDKKIIETAISSLGAMLNNVGSMRGKQSDVCNEMSALLYGEEKISLEVMRSYLERTISSTRRRKDFLSGKVNFCTLEPMRSIPFKHIFIMGLDGDSFPVVDRSVGFDLTQVPHLQKRGSGDRSSLDDSRYLFLEALVSAEDSFYVSYVGRSATDASERNPAVPVTELVNFISRSFVSSDLFDVVKELKKKDVGLDDFRSKLFEQYKENENRIAARVQRQDALSLRERDNYRTDDNNHLGFCSYQNQWYPIAMHMHEPSLPEDWEIKSMITDSGVISDIQLKEEGNGKQYVLTLTDKNLYKFLKHPDEEFDEKRFDVKRDYSGSLSEIPDDEPFVTSDDKSLKDIKKKYLKQLINDKSGERENILKRFSAELKMSGLLPIEILSKDFIERAQQTLIEMADVIKPNFDEKNQITELIDLEFDLPQDVLPEKMRISNYKFTVRIRYPEADVYEDHDGIRHFISVNMMDSEESVFRKSFVRALCFAVHSDLCGRIDYNVSFPNMSKNSGNIPLLTDKKHREFRASVLFAIIARYIWGMRKPAPRLWFYSDNHNDDSTIDNVLSEEMMNNLQGHNRKAPLISTSDVIENYCKLKVGNVFECRDGSGKTERFSALSLNDWLAVIGYSPAGIGKTPETLFEFAKETIKTSDLSRYNQHVINAYGLADSARYQKFDESVMDVVYASFVHSVLPQYFMAKN